MEKVELKFFENDVELAGAAATQWLNVVAKTEKHLVAFSGGRIATTFFTAIRDLSIAKGIPLGHVDFFWADERCVPPDDLESNFLLANEILFRRLKIAPEKIHRLKGELDPDVAVAEANDEISRIATKNTAGLPVLDLIFLGMGPDAHTASLFPDASNEILNAEAPFLVVKNSPKPPPSRITLSYATIAAAKEVWLLAAGKGKEKALADSLSTNGQTPVARVIRSRSHTKIFSDIRLEQLM